MLTFSATFQSKYPSLTQALIAMQSGTPVERNTTSKNQIENELRTICEDAENFREAFGVIWQQLGESRTAFIQCTLKAHSYLGVCDAVRQFIGNLWLVALKDWPTNAQELFIQEILDVKPKDIFQVLDFVAPVFIEIQFSESIMATWLFSACKAIGNDLYQRGLWQCAQNYSQYQSTSALDTIELWLDGEMVDFMRNMIAKMLCWIRESETAKSNPLKLKIEKLEARLRSLGCPEWRALFLESYAFGVPAKMTESQALALRDELVKKESRTEESWCVLLLHLIGSDGKTPLWVHRELCHVAGSSTSTETRYWLIQASLIGWQVAMPESEITRESWTELVFTILPFKPDEKGALQYLTRWITECFRRKAPPIHDFFIRLAAVIGGTWAASITENHNTSAMLSHALRTAQQTTPLVTALCFSPSREARHMGIMLLYQCETAIEVAAANTATAVQIELLLLELVVLYAKDVRILARLHAILAPRIDKLGEPLAGYFYDEVLIQSMNSHGYREALLEEANNHKRLLECIDEAKRRIHATVAAISSPALQMDVPGWTNAIVNSRQNFDKKIREQTKQYSLLSAMCTNVPLLYGTHWRHLDYEGKLSDASALQTIETSIEIPRLEFSKPEVMDLRRIQAEMRISDLQSEDAQRQAT